MSGLFTLVDGMSVSILQSCETKFYGDTSGYTLYGETGILHAGSERYQVFNAEPALEMVPLQAYPPPTLSTCPELAAFADHVNEAALGSTTGASERQICCGSGRSANASRQWPTGRSW
ncbi:MAG: hypothetical protein R2932_41545 [Caldilineaceae bacterium]